jgi:hypothetical protein
MDKIYSVTIITAQGVNAFRVGGKVQTMDDGEYIDNVISKIEKTGLRITGDPYDHYCGYDDKGKMLFSVNCLAPCEVIYS